MKYTAEQTLINEPSDANPQDKSTGSENTTRTVGNGCEGLV